MVVRSPTQHSCVNLIALIAVVCDFMLIPPVSDEFQLTPWTDFNCSGWFMELLGVYYTALDAWRVGAGDLKGTNRINAIKQCFFCFLSITLHI